ncbi:MAG: SPW repeat protein [Gemmatimonadota bacterium]
MTRMKHWQDALNAVLGIWLIVSAWVLGFQTETTAMANAVIVGVLLLAAALGAMFVPRAWEEWVELVLGLWLIASPWLLRFSTLPDARANAVLAGLVTAILAIWVLLIDKDYGTWRRGGAAQ